MRTSVSLLALLVASPAMAREELDTTSHRLEYVLERIDNLALANADEHRRNAEWFKWARIADAEAKARRFQQAFFGSGIVATVSAPTNVLGCPNGDASSGYSCPTAQGTWYYSSPSTALSSGGALKGSQTWYAGFTRPNWVLPGVDYGIGATTTKAVMLANPATYDLAYTPDGGVTHPNVPAGCTYAATGWTWNTAMPWLNCLNSTGTAGALTFKDKYLGAAYGRKSIGIELSRSVNNVLQNVYMDNDADILAVTKQAGFTVGQIYLPNTTVNLTMKNVTMDGHYGDGTNCCDTGFGAWFQVLTTGAMSLDQVVMTNFVQYAFSIISSGDTGPKASLSLTHSILDSCQPSIAVGHTECWAGGRGWSGMTISFNVFNMKPNFGQHEEFMHNTGTSSPASVDNLTITYNVELSKPNGSAAGALINGVQFQLNNGTFELTAAWPDANMATELVQGIGLNSAINPSTGLTQAGSFQLWKPVSTNAFGPTFQTSCGGQQTANVWCPMDTSAQGVYVNTTNVAATTGGQMVTKTFNNMHGWYRTPATGVTTVHDNYVDLTGVLNGWMTGFSDCTGVTSKIWFNNIDLSTGSAITGFSAPVNGC